MPTRRVITRDLSGPEALQVSRNTGDTYAGAERPVIDNNMDRLAQSLSSFSGALNSFTRRNEVDLKKQEAERRKQEEARIAEETARYQASVTDTQLAQDVAGGNAPYQSHPIGAAAYQGAIGTNVGQRFVQNIQSTFGEGGTDSLINPDGTPKNIDELLTGQARGYLEGVPQGTPHGAQAFLKTGVEPAKLWAQQEQKRQVAAFNARAQATTAGVGLRSVFTGVELDKLTPEQVGQRMTQGFQEIAQVTPGSTYDQLENTFVGSLKTTLSGGNSDPQTARNVLSVLNAPRVDPATGKALPSLSQDPRFKTDVDLLRQQATGILSQDWSKQQKEGFFRTAANAFAKGDGSFDAIQDFYVQNPFTGERTLFKADEVKEGAITYTRQFTRSRVADQLKDQPPEVVNGQVFIEEANLFIPNGVVNTGWKSFLGSAIRDAADPTSLTDPAKLAKLGQAANLYEAIRSRSPSSVGDYVSGKEKDFFEAFHLFRKDGTPVEQALSQASAILSPDAADDRQLVTQYEKIDSAVKSLGADGGARGWFFNRGTPINLGLANTEITRRARNYLRAGGMSPEAAVKAAAEAVQKEVPGVNGVLQFNRSAFLTHENVPVAQQALSSVWTVNQDALRAQGVDGPEDLSLSFVGNSYRVIIATTGSPVGGVNNRLLTLSDADLRAVKRGMGQQKNDEILRKREEAAAQRKAGQELRKGDLLAPVYDFVTDPQAGQKMTNFNKGVADILFGDGLMLPHELKQREEAEKKRSENRQKWKEERQKKAEERRKLNEEQRKQAWNKQMGRKP